MAVGETRPRILIVDDDAMFLRLLHHILSQAGFDVEESGNTWDARKLLEQGRCSMLITDLNMPGENGLDLVRDLRGKNADLPVLILSGSLDEDVQQEADRLGRVECMGKPIDQKRLLGVVRSLLDVDSR